MKFLLLFSSVAAIFIFVLFPSPAYASESLACVEGIVENHGNPVAGAEVELKNPKSSGSEPLAIDVTNAGGQYTLCADIPVGKYLVVRNAYNLNKQIGVLKYVSGMGAWVELTPGATVSLTLDLPKVIHPIMPASPLHHISVGERSPIFQWELLPEAQKYSLQVIQDQEPWTRVHEVSGLTGASYKLPIELDPNTPYYWLLTASDAEGRFVGAFGEFEHFQISETARNVEPNTVTPSAIAPALLSAPEIIVPTSYAVLKNFPRRAQLKWQPVRGAASYEVVIECDICGDNPWESKYGPYRLRNAALLTIPLAGDNLFRFRVRAVANDGTVGPWSSDRYFSYDTSRSVRTAPANLPSTIQPAGMISPTTPSRARPSVRKTVVMRGLVAFDDGDTLVLVNGDREIKLLDRFGQSPRYIGRFVAVRGYEAEIDGEKFLIIRSITLFRRRTDVSENIPSRGLPDLVVKRIHIRSDSATNFLSPDGKALWFVEIKNIGEACTGNVNFRVSLKGIDKNNVRHEAVVPFAALNPEKGQPAPHFGEPLCKETEEGKGINYIFHVPPDQLVQVEATIDTENTVREQNENNNTTVEDRFVIP